MIKAWNIAAILIAGLVIGYGVGWWMNRSDSGPYTTHTVGDYDYMVFHDFRDYDFIIYGGVPEYGEPDDYVDYEGFGISWPEESREERPRLVALITEDYLELVDFEALPPGFQEAVLEEAHRGLAPRIPVKYDDDTSDDPR